jgi:putative ABC transport system permease protein
MAINFVCLWRRLAFRGRRRGLEQELAEELEFHRALKQRDYCEAGLAPEAAAQRTRQEMGNITLAQEQSRDTWSFLAMERLWQDIRYALRMFSKNLGFTAFAVLSLALGIGGNAAVFSLVNSLLLQPLPYPQSDRLLRITEVYPKAAFALFKERSRAMDIASASPGSEFSLIGDGETVRVLGSSVSTNLFSVLEVSPMRGRTFEPGEERPGGDQVALLSYQLWEKKFGADPQIVGRMVSLNGVDRRVVGVMPPRFNFPSSRIQLWIPARLDPSVMEDYWGSEYTPLFARLRPGMNLGQAQREVQPIVAELRKLFPFPMPRDWNAQATAVPLHQDMVGDARKMLLILLAAVALVLLIACANVASLMLSRATVRRKEIALRAVLGAGRARILRQMLTECVLLSILGGAVGVLFGITALSVFKSVLPSETPGLAEASVNFYVLGGVAALSVATGLAFGIFPAIVANQPDLSDSIRTGSQRSTAHIWTRVRAGLIAGELALTVVLVVAAGLLIKTLYVLSRVDPGFRAEHILTIRIGPNQSLCDNRLACVALYNNLLERARGISGVSDAAIANTIPMDGKYVRSSIPVDVEGHPKTADFPAPMFWAGAISPNYYEIMRIPLIAGRRFTPTDGASSSSVVMIDAACAKRFWPGENAVGKHIKPVWDSNWRTIIGVVGDVHQFDLTDRAPHWIQGAIYMPYPQSVQGDRQLPAAMNLLVKTSSDPRHVGEEVRNLAIGQNPNVPVGEVQTMESVVSSSVANNRATTSVFTLFGAAAIILAVVGIYGLVSYTVSQRTYEIGVRVAIGATKTKIVGMVVKQGIGVAACGISVGLVAAALLTRFLSGLLYGVTVSDTLTFVGVTLLLMLIVAAASSVPAWRASQIDPVKSLRTD